MPTRYKAIKVNGVKYDEHRWLMEQHLGRKLETWETVHHKDENPRNNDIDNLEVMSKSDHARMHGKERGISELAIKRSAEARRGVTPSWARLSPEDVQYIRDNYLPRDKEFGCRALGRKFNISHQLILRILTGEYYKNV